MAKYILYYWKFLLLAVIYVIQIVGISAQAPDIEWQKSLGGSGWDEAFCIIQTFDSCYVVAGKRGSIDGDAASCGPLGGVWVMKLSQGGEILWSACYGGSGPDGAQSLIQTNDGGYIIAGYTNSTDGDITYNHGGSDSWIIKIDNIGNLEWQKTYGGSNFERANCIVQTQDGGYVFCSESGSTDGDVTGHHGEAGPDDYWVVKINFEGEIEWQKSLGGTDDDNAESIIITDDGGILVAGYSFSVNGDVTGNHGYTDYWIIKLNADGSIQWEKSYGGSDEDDAFSVVSTFDNGFLLTAGGTLSDDGDVSLKHSGIWGDYWIVQIDSLGELVWQKCLGGTGADQANSIQLTADSMFIICGTTNSNDFDVTETFGEVDFWIVKINAEGIIQWQKTYGGSDYDNPQSIIETLDGGYIAAGWSRSVDGDVTGNHGNYDYWIVKLAPPCTEILYYADLDHDNFGDIGNDSLSCNIPDGYVYDSTDCNDANGLIFPTATDICNAIDDNCNGLIDEDATAFNWFIDADNDGFGDVLNDSVSCFILSGFVLDSTDCDDSNILINSAATEICNALDDNCNADIDEGLIFYTFFVDADGDGFGDSDTYLNSCFEEVIGYVLDSSDCNDANNNMYPGAEEICNYLDDDCDGIADDNLTYILSFEDADNDNYGNIAVDSLSCELPDGFVLTNTDCDDTNPEIYPGAPEILNGADDDCNGSTDEGLQTNNILLSLLNIYPNPASEMLYIEYWGNEQLAIEIVNVTGSIIYSNAKLLNPQTINISKFASGAYVIKIQTASGEASVVFVKN